MKKKVLIVISDYYEEIGKNLLKGSINELKLNNINYDILFHGIKIHHMFGSSALYFYPLCICTLSDSLKLSICDIARCNYLTFISFLLKSYSS